MGVRGDAMNRLYRGMVEANVRRAIDVADQVAAIDQRMIEGRAREIFASDLLAPLLYPTMGICTGVAIDRNGARSSQTDVIVYDKRIVPPLLLAVGEGMVPCESVLFAIEVKSTLTHEDLVKSVEWACSMKALEYDTTVYIEGEEVSSIPCGLFAFKTDLAESRSIQDEVARLEEVVKARNAVAAQEIRVPLSTLTVASRGHAQCTKAGTHLRSGEP
jgi:hypothetical protein